MEKEDLRFLIQQTEERIKIVDTKASIIIAFFALLLGSNKYFQMLVKEYDIPIWYCYILICLLLISFFFLILTIRPVTGKKIFWDFKKNKNENEPKNDNEKTVKIFNDFWIEEKTDLKRFDIKKIKSENIDNYYQYMFKQLSERRINKYKYYRISMMFLRISLIVFIPFLGIVFIG